jgi:hypothetical protein
MVGYRFRHEMKIPFDINGSESYSITDFVKFQAM